MDGAYHGLVVSYISMCPRDHRRRWSAFTCSLLMAAAAQLAAAPRANATCGDWLAHPGDTSSSRHHKIDGTTQADPASTNEKHRSDKLPLSKPCQGPLCRSAPSQPMPTAPVNLSFPSDKLALFGSAETQPAERRQFYPGDDSDAHPDRGFPTRIDHPPRA